MRKYLLSALGLTAFIVLVLSPLSAYAAPPKGVKYLSQPFHSPTLSVAQKHHPHFYIRNHAHQQRPAAPADTAIPYQGGPIMSGNVAVYTIFWQPSGSQVDSNYNSLINQFFNDFSQSTVFQITQQYQDSNGDVPGSVSLGGTWSSDTLGEIGDPCSTSYPDPNPAFNGGDITGNGNFYTVQEEWSNAAGGCALTFP